MPDVVATGPVTTALLAALTGGGLLTGDGKIPDGGGWPAAPRQAPFEPYCVLHGLEDGETSGTIESPNADGHSPYQVTGVGETREQAEWVADKARAALLGSRPTAVGRTITNVTAEHLSGARRDDTVAPPVWFTTDMFDVLHTV